MSELFLSGIKTWNAEVVVGGGEHLFKDTMSREIVHLKKLNSLWDRLSRGPYILQPTLVGIAASLVATYCGISFDHFTIVTVEVQQELKI